MSNETPPPSRVAIAQGAPGVGRPRPAPATPYFAVSPTKFVVISICTLGLYEFYWFYRQWWSIKERESSRAIPVLRALFSPLFCYALLRRIRRSAQQIDGGSTLFAGLLTTGYVFFVLVGQVPGPYGLASLLTVGCLVPAQVCANRVNAHLAPDHDRNDRFGLWNWIGIVIGGIALISVVVIAALPSLHGHRSR